VLSGTNIMFGFYMALRGIITKSTGFNVGIQTCTHNQSTENPKFHIILTIKLNKQQPVNASLKNKLLKFFFTNNKHSFYITLFNVEDIVVI